MNKSFFNLFSVIIIFFNFCSMATAKPTAPVIIDHQPQKSIETGTSTQSIIKIIAKSNLQKLAVSIVPYSGLRLITGNSEIEFFNIKTGDVNEVEVFIQLEENIGYLSVHSMTVDLGGNVKSKSVVLRYNALNTSKTLKMKAKGFIENSKGEKVILMPGEAR